MTFWKRQNNKKSNQINSCQRQRAGGRESPAKEQEENWAGRGGVDENVLYHHFDGVTRPDMFVNSLSYTPEKDELYVNCNSINPT